MGRIALPFGDGRITHPYDKPSFSYTQRFGLNRRNPIARGIVSCWPFNEGAGNFAYDISGNQNTATFGTGPLWKSDQFRKHITMDGGVANYLSAPNNSYTTGKNFSVTLWVKSDNYGSGEGLFSMGDAFDDGVPTLVLQGQTGSVRMYSRDGWTGSEPLTAEQWFFIAVVFDDTNSTMYVDGTQRVQRAIADEIGNRGSYWIGSGFVGEFDGEIDMPIIWNRPISQTEINQLYHEQFILLHHPELVQYQVSAVAGVVIPPVTPTVKKRDFLSWGQMTSDNMTSNPHKGMGVV